MKKYVLTILIILISFFIDKSLAIFIASNRVFFLDKLVSIILMFKTPVIFVLITIMMLKNRKLILPLWLSFFTTGLLVTFIKIISNRARPFIALNLTKITNIDYNFSSWNASFPSWHVAAVFLALPFIDKLSRNYRISWIIFAILIAVSRLYTGFHYLSDILSGAVIGYSIGLLFLYLEEKNKITKRLIKARIS